MEPWPDPFLCPKLELRMPLGVWGIPVMILVLLAEEFVEVLAEEGMYLSEGPWAELYCLRLTWRVLLEVG